MPVTLRLVAAAVAWAGCTNSELARQTNGGLRAPIRVSIGWDRCAWPRACSMGRGYRPELIRMAIDRPDSNEPRPSVPPPLEDRRYRVLAETAPDAIVTLDERTCILSVNPAAERIFGWNADQMVGQSIEMLLPERNRSGHDASLSRYLRSGERNVSWSRVFVHALARDGREIPMEISFGEFLENGRRVFAGFMRDVSERVAQQQLLERTTGDLELALAELEARVHEAEAARTAADEANAAKSRFLATMSHELRTPLNAIGGYVELLEIGLRGELNDAQRADLRRVRRAQARLLALINDILTFAKLETGRIGYDIRDVPVAALLASLGAMIEPQAHAKRITYEWRRALEDVLVCADAQKVEQILLNLLSNAVKFTDPGGRIVLSTTADADEIRITVRDTGRGIPADRLDAVFEPFVQVDATLTREHEGTGLGLSISQELARGMGGDIAVESTFGVGSAFTLSLPAGTSLGVSVEHRTSMGELLAGEARVIVGRVVARLRADPDVPPAAQTELEDHLASLVTDLAQLLVILDSGPQARPGPLIADGSRIQRVITELHGAQRHRLGWTAELTEREFDYLADEAADALRRRAPDHAALPVEETVALVRALLSEAKHMARTAFDAGAP